VSIREIERIGKWRFLEYDKGDVPDRGDGVGDVFAFNVRSGAVNAT
jgi:hypothetical protein